MKVYTVNETGRKQITEYLRCWLRGSALEYFERGDAGTLESWFSDAEVNANEYGGGFEIPASMSATCNPLPVHFGPECFDVQEIEE